MKRRGLLLLVCLVAVGGSSQADGNISNRRKSPVKAFGLSLAGTIAPGAASIPLFAKDVSGSHWSRRVGGALVVSGLIVGPATGHFYAFNRRAAWKGIIIRSIGGGMVGYGFYKIDSIVGDDDPAGFLIVAGSIVVLVSTIGDIARADGSARSYNERQGLTGQSWQPGFWIGEDAVGVHVTVRW